MEEKPQDRPEDRRRRGPLDDEGKPEESTRSAARSGNRGQGGEDTATRQDAPGNGGRTPASGTPREAPGADGDAAERHRARSTNRLTFNASFLPGADSTPVDTSTPQGRTV